MAINKIKAMSPSPLITFLSQALRKSTRFLVRDYFELEHLQSSKRNTTDFVASANKRLYEALSDNLKRYPNSVVSIDKAGLNNKPKICFLVEPIDGISNLERAIPIFCTLVTCYENKGGDMVLTAAMMYFPILGDIVYATQGGGSWVDKAHEHSVHKAARLRVASSEKDASQLLYLTDNPAKFNKSSRSFHCDSYSAYLVAAGKADLFFSDNISHIAQEVATLLVKEAGGSVAFSNGQFAAASAAEHILLT